jgi:hypothetical protein
MTYDSFSFWIGVGTGIIGGFAGMIILKLWDVV